MIALAVNLSSLVAKGWGWPGPEGRRAPQLAGGPGGDLVGAAVNDLSVAVAGEAARVHLIVQRGGVPAGAALSSVLWTRVAEGVALASWGCCRGVRPEHAVAAGLALQGLQVLPVLFLGAMATGWRLPKLESELA